MCNRNVLLGLLPCLAVAGCSSHWVKPDGSSPLWDLDSCSAQAEARYPVKNEVVYSAKYNYPITPLCSKKQREKDNNRFSVPDYRLPQLESDIVDVNWRTRTALSDACMRGKGWREVYNYPWNR